MDGYARILGPSAELKVLRLKRSVRLPHFEPRKRRTHRRFRRNHRTSCTSLQFILLSFKYNLADGHLFTQIYRIFFKHLKSTITHLEIYLSSHPMVRDSSFNMKEMKDFIEKYRKDIEKPVKTTGKGKNDDSDDSDDDRGEGSSQLPVVSQTDYVYLDPDAPFTPMEFIASQGFKLSQFSFECSQVVGAMQPSPKSYSNRSDRNAAFRVIATSGLEWNVQSKSRNRDFLVGSVAAVIEARFVEQYREKLLDRCRGAAYMRLELHDYFVTIAKTNAVDRSDEEVVEDDRRVSGRNRSKSSKGGKGGTKGNDPVQVSISKPVSTAEWFFADLIEIDSKAINDAERNVQKLSKELVESHSLTVDRKTDPMFRVVDSVAKCPYVLCEAKDVPKGSVETVAYVLMQGLTRVRHLFYSSQFP
jgi:hypothetical protein